MTEVDFGGAQVPDSGNLRKKAAPLDYDDTMPTLLDDIREELKTEVVVPPIKLVVESRPNFAVQYLPDFEMERIQHWQRRSVLKVDKDSIDVLKFSRFALLHSFQGLWYKGKLVRKTDGAVMSLRDREFIEMTQQMDENAAMDWLFGNDSQILVHAARVLGEAGYNADGSSAISADDDDHPLGAASRG